MYRSIPQHRATAFYHQTANIICPFSIQSQCGREFNLISRITPPSATVVYKTCIWNQPIARRSLRNAYICSLSSGGDGGGGLPPKKTVDDSDSNESDDTTFLAAIVTTLLAYSTCANRRRANAAEIAQPPRVSIIIPVLNESKGIKDCLDYLNTQLVPPAYEVIVVDGGSSDDTVKVVKSVKKARVVKSGRGRGRQMNAGADKARGDYLVFVHSDSRPPRDLIALIRKTLKDDKVVLGGFFTSIEYKGSVLWPTTIHHFIKTCYAPLIFMPGTSFFKGMRCLFGDQSMFCRKSQFDKVGGFKAELPIMEDADLCLKMHKDARSDGKSGRIVQLNAVNRTSGRRIGQWGSLKATYIQFRIALAWWLGATPEHLHELYHKIYTDAFR